jgi:DNA (cytosine-5)-methyltransferase 1
MRAAKVYRSRTVRRPRRRYRERTEGKQPFRVPSMAEIEAIPWNGLTVASTFSGAGGSCLGYRMAGYRVLWASECDPKAWDSYKANHPRSHLDTRDIREVKPEEVLERCGLERGELDLFDGSPPCVSFSLSGKREKLWGQEREHAGVVQTSVDLFEEYARLVEGIQPRAFVAENVYGMIVGKAKGMFKEYFRLLESVGYRVMAGDLDAQWLGVPQRRRRIIMVGVRKDLGLAPVFPDPLPYRYSLADALPWIGSVKVDPHGWFGGDELDPDQEPAYTVITKCPNAMKVTGQVVSNDGYDPKWGGPDEPHPTIMANGPCGSSGYLEGTRVVGNTTGAADKKVDQGVDGPVPTIRAGRPDSIRLVGSSTGRRAGKVVQGADEPAPCVMATGIDGVGPSQLLLEGAPPVEEEARRAMAGAVGDRWEKLREGEQDPERFNLIRPSRDEPSPTVLSTGGGGLASVAHPVERRKFSIGELKRICGFPDDFVLKGSYADQWARLGNAVPPVMMSHVAAALRDGVLKK